MLTSLYSGISGLLANADALDIVGNNISNSNTTGFKASSASFEDVLYQTVAGTSGTGQVGRGVALGAVQTDFSPGSVETTNSSTDLAIGGQGFFIVKKTGDNTDYYTRAGGFSLDKVGNMTDSNGDFLQGKVIDQTTGTATGVDTNISISQQPSQPKSTQTIDMVVNLESDSAWKGECTITGGTGITNIAAASGSYPAAGNYTFAVTGPAVSGSYPVSLTIPNSQRHRHHYYLRDGDEQRHGNGLRRQHRGGRERNLGRYGSRPHLRHLIVLRDGRVGDQRRLPGERRLPGIGQLYVYHWCVGGRQLPRDPHPSRRKLCVWACDGQRHGSGLRRQHRGGWERKHGRYGAFFHDPHGGRGHGLRSRFPAARSPCRALTLRQPLTQSNTTNYSSSETVYDSLGTAHTVTVNFRKAAVDTASQTSTWEWNVTVSGQDTVAAGGSGIMTFNENGVLTSGGSPQAVTFDFAGAQQNQVINLVLGSASGEGSSTQYSSSSKTTYVGQDGYAPGVLQSVSVSQNGVISGTYDNGQILQLYQITLANFDNPQGLKKEGGNLYSATLDSGNAYTNAPGQGGTGKISSNSLEGSNVDLATEFVKMIVAQRGYEANSKVITTTDQILQSLMNIKQ